jgi:hypothetical protein
MDQFAFLQHGDAQTRANTSKLNSFDDLRIALSVSWKA